MKGIWKGYERDMKGIWKGYENKKNIGGASTIFSDCVFETEADSQINVHDHVSAGSYRARCNLRRKSWSWWQNFDKICQKQGIYQRPTIYQQMEGGARTFVTMLQSKTMQTMQKYKCGARLYSTVHCKTMQNNAKRGRRNVDCGGIL